MLQSFLTEMGPWSWWIFGLLLLAAELLVPGVFLVWIGLAAITVGAASLALWGMAVWGWEVQMLVFAVLSVVFVLAGRRVYGRTHASDEPLLNQRGATLIGRIGTLADPITDGRGRLRLDDTTWPISGPDLAAGSRVRVMASEGARLVVEKA